MPQKTLTRYTDGFAAGESGERPCADIASLLILGSGSSAGFEAADEPGDFERVMYCTEERGVIIGGGDGLYPRLGSLTSGSGFLSPRHSRLDVGGRSEGEGARFQGLMFTCHLGGRRRAQPHLERNEHRRSSRGRGG